MALSPLRTSSTIVAPPLHTYHTGMLPHSYTGFPYSSHHHCTHSLRAYCTTSTNATTTAHLHYAPCRHGFHLGGKPPHRIALWVVRARVFKNQLRSILSVVLCKICVMTGSRHHGRTMRMLPCNTCHATITSMRRHAAHVAPPSSCRAMPFTSCHTIHAMPFIISAHMHAMHMHHRDVGRKV